MTHAIHDFSAKLRQPAVAPRLAEYVLWRRAVRAAESAGETPPAAPESAPVSINLDLTTSCNYRCDHCVDWDILNTAPRFEEPDLRASLALMARRGMRSVILIGGGEPTLYPGFVEFVRFLKQDLAQQVAVVSNGSRGDRLLEIAPLLDADDWIRLSLDSASNELFESMHRPNGKLDLDSICAWIPRVKAANPAPRVGFSYIIVWSGASREDVALHENIHEIVPATVRAREYGFDYISFKPVLERHGDGAEVMDPSKTREGTSEVVRRIRAAVDEAKELAREDFRVYESINLSLLESGGWRDYTRQPRTCHMQALRQVLTPLGLYNCPAHRGVAKARLGDKDAYADEQRAARTGARLAELLAGFDASRECSEVTCLYNQVNWWIEGMVDERGGDPPLIAPVAPPGNDPEARDFFL